MKMTESSLVTPAKRTGQSGQVKIGRFLEVVSTLDPRLGGISTVVPRLSAELADTSALEVELCFFGRPTECEYAACSDRGLPMSSWSPERSSWIIDTTLRKTFREVIRASDGIHIHGLWETASTVASHFARALKKPYVLSAHGMLEPWALSNKALKKRVYSALVEKHNLQGAACLHALTEAEVDDYRRLGCRQPVAVIPNGVDAPSSAAPSLFLKNFPQLIGKDIILFLGRLHFKKGLDLLVKAWGAIARDYPTASLVFAGPDSENSVSAIRQLIDDHGISDRIVFTGMLTGDLKWSAFASATSFVLPSYSEGLSVAVLEALCMGVPVIISENCHLPEVATQGAGWVIPAEVNALQSAISKVLMNEGSMNRQIGECGKILARDFQWQSVAAKMAELYSWTAGGPLPTSFELQGYQR